MSFRPRHDWTRGARVNGAQLFTCERAPPREARWDRPPGTHQVGWFDRIKPTLGKAEASRTPLAFRDELLAMARSARRVERPALAKPVG